MKANLEEFGSSRPTIFMADADIARAADWAGAVEALTAAYAMPIDPAMVPPRTMARGEDVWMRSLTAISPSGRHMGCKLISAKLRGRPVLASYLLALIRQDNLQAAAIMDANRITGLRTAATAVVALNSISQDKEIELGILGAGFESRNFLQALHACRPVKSVRVFSPTPASRQGFAQNFRDEFGLDITAVETAEEAVRGANTVLCAARSRDETPILEGSWIEKGASVLSLGSTLPEQREVGPDTMARVRLIVADMEEEVLHETGDALAAIAAGVDVAGKLVSLCDVVAGKIAVRSHSDDIVLYKSVGTALQDVVIAEMLFDRALEIGSYTQMPISIEPVAK